MSSRHRVGLSADLLHAGAPVFGPEPLALLDDAAIAWDWLPPAGRIGPQHVADYDALYINTPHVTPEAFARGPGRLRVIARHGVGYDSVDIPACTAAGVLVTIQPEGVRRPLAVAALTLLLALAGRLFAKDRLVRQGRWHERMAHMGLGLVGRTVGVVGAGSIGRELLGLLRPFGLRLLACDPVVDAATIAALGAERVALDALLAASDFVVLLVPLHPGTRHLIGAAQLAWMKPHAFLINVARGSVVDEAALIAALQQRRIAGAALDVFEQEPVDPANPLLAMDNVILAPHALCWTDQCFAGLANSALAGIRTVLDGGVPANAVNPDAVARRHG